MYLSGLPLHVITLTLANEYRQAMGPQTPISFSAGIDRKNVAARCSVWNGAGDHLHRFAEDWRLRPVAALLQGTQEGDGRGGRRND